MLVDRDTCNGSEVEHFYLKGKFDTNAEIFLYFTRVSNFLRHKKMKCLRRNTFIDEIYELTWLKFIHTNGLVFFFNGIKNLQ